MPLCLPRTKEKFIKYPVPCFLNTSPLVQMFPLNSKFFLINLILFLSVIKNKLNIQLVLTKPNLLLYRHLGNRELNFRVIKTVQFKLICQIRPGHKKCNGRERDYQFVPNVNSSGIIKHFNWFVNIIENNLLFVLFRWVVKLKKSLFLYSFFIKKPL